MQRVAALFAGAILSVVSGTAQQPQNPSAMVEHTRPHPRIEKRVPPGRRDTLQLGEIYVPAHLRVKKTLPLLVFFHGGTWLPEEAAARSGRAAVISIQAGAGSTAYARLFADPGRFGELLREAEAKVGVRFRPVALGGWSAGYGAVREILKQTEYYDLVERVLLIDGLHTGYVGRKPGPEESRLEADPLDVFLSFARDAVAGRKTMMITHSEIFPGTFASTTECSDWLLVQLGLSRRAVLKHGPMGTQQLSEVRAGRFLLFGYAGNSAPDHVDQLHSLPDYLKLLWH